MDDYNYFTDVEAAIIDDLTSEANAEKKTPAEGYSLLPWHDVDLTLASPRNSTRLVSPVFWPELTQVQFYSPVDGEVMGYISVSEANAILNARGLDIITEVK